MTGGDSERIELEIASVRLGWVWREDSVCGEIGYIMHWYLGEPGTNSGTIWEIERGRERSSL